MLVGTVLGGIRGWAFTTLLGDMKGHTWWHVGHVPMHDGHKIVLKGH